MTTAIDDLMKKFDGFHAALTKVLDKFTALEAWKSSASTLMETLLSQSERTASRIDNLESAPTLSMAPHPPPRPTTAPPQPPSRRTDPFDLNTAPQQEMRPPASAWERPSRHRVATNHRDAGGGILGSHPPHPVTGMPHNSPPQTHDCDADLRLNGSRLGPVPKLEFPKFDGENPRLWKDCCEMYFEVYNVSDSLKTRFAALKFLGTAASWLHSVECKGRITD